MSRFYFHIRSGSHIATDEEGSECSDAASARTEALAHTRDLLIDLLKGSKDKAPDAFIVADSSGRELMTILFSEALPKLMRRQPL